MTLLPRACSRRSLRRLRRKLLADRAARQEEALEAQVTELLDQLIYDDTRGDTGAMLTRVLALTEELRRLRDYQAAVRRRAAQREAREAPAAAHQGPASSFGHSSSGIASGSGSISSEVFHRHLGESLLHDLLLLPPLPCAGCMPHEAPCRKVGWAWVRNPGVAFCICSCAFACCFLLLRPTGM